MGELTDSVSESSSVWASLLWANSHVGGLTVKRLKCRFPSMHLEIFKNKIFHCHSRTNTVHKRFSTIFWQLKLTFIENAKSDFRSRVILCRSFDLLLLKTHLYLSPQIRRANFHKKYMSSVLIGYFLSNQRLLYIQRGQTSNISTAGFAMLTSQVLSHVFCCDSSVLRQFGKLARNHNFSSIKNGLLQRFQLQQRWQEDETSELLPVSF